MQGSESALGEKINQILGISVENIRTLREACDFKKQVEQSLQDTLVKYQKSNPFLNIDDQTSGKPCDQIVDNVITHYKKIFELTGFINFVSAKMPSQVIIAPHDLSKCTLSVLEL